jgi:hypothetical protein
MSGDYIGTSTCVVADFTEQAYRRDLQVAAVQIAAGMTFGTVLNFTHDDMMTPECLAECEKQNIRVRQFIAVESTLLAAEVLKQVAAYREGAK